MESLYHYNKYMKRTFRSTRGKCGNHIEVIAHDKTFWKETSNYFIIIDKVKDLITADARAPYICIH